MKVRSRLLGLAKWGLTVLTGLFLLGMALAPWDESKIARGRSFQIADGFLTLRVWTGAERAPPETPSDQVPEGSIPDTRNLPLWIVILVLAVPTALLWWTDRRPAASTPAGEPSPTAGRAPEPRWPGRTR